MSLKTATAAPLVALLLSLTLCVTGAGCSYLMPTVVDDDIDLAELDDDGKQELVDEEEEDEFEELDESPSKVQDLDGKSKSGDRYPLSKTVEHRLTQIDNEGTRTSTSRAEIQLTLVVDRVLSDGRKQMSVTYDRVQFEQLSGGKRVFYSSDKLGEPVPPEAFLYAGLAGNGFGFWLDASNQVSDVTGFSDFLQRCLRSVPLEHRENVKMQLDASKSEDGVATFIDDSVGMLPYRFDPRHTNVAVSQGTEWELAPRYCDSPVQMITNVQCVLRELTANFADIRLTGQISGPNEPVTVLHAEGEFTVLVKGGKCNGTCRIDRRTGLPTLSQIQHDVDLVIEFPDGNRVEQNKVTFSTLSSQSSLLRRPEAYSDSHVESASYQQSFRKEKPGRVVPAGKFRQN
ncbi:DUF6263 family protein [Schlesneria sp.]|uniref:DUF6263 family protein n=1 Tax=Schlesneria sp. TaxID=2762018 RepID=UPI002EEADA5D